MEMSVGGRLRSKSHKRVANLIVFVKGVEKNGMGIATTDSIGDFVLDFDKSYNDPKPVLFYYVNGHNDTVLLRRVYKFRSDNPQFIFWIK